MLHSLKIPLVTLFILTLVCISRAHAQDCTESVPITFKNGDIEIQGQLFLPGAEIPSQMVVYLAGFPPSERGDATLFGSSICEAGWAVFYFHYRGTRSTQGIFTVANAIEDAIEAVAFVQATYSPDALALVGHSFGGLVALQVGAHTNVELCVAATSAPNPRVMGTNFAQVPEAREGWIKVFDSFVGTEKAITSASGRSEAEFFIEHGATLDITRRAEALSEKRLLLIGASEDKLVPVKAHLEPLVNRLQEFEGTRLTKMVIETDHNYTTKRQVLAEIVTDWLADVCLAM